MPNSLDQKLHELIQHAYANAPATRKRFDEAGVSPGEIQSVADLVKLPVLSKDRVIAMQQEEPPFGGLLAVPRQELRHIYFSPGPLYEVDAGDQDTQRMAAEALRRSGFGPGDVVLNTLSYHLVPAGSLLDESLINLGAAAIPGGVGNSDLQVKMMADLGVTGYVGTPSFLLILLEKAKTAGLSLKLSKALVTAEPLFPKQRQMLTEEYGLQVGNAYGTADLGFLAVNTDGGMAMRLLPEPIIEIVDPQTGKSVPPGTPGEVVVTNFNHAYPLIRLGTGDMGILTDPDPGNTAQDERAITLVGRSGEAVKVRGMFVHPNQLRFAVGLVVPGAAVQGIVSQRNNQDLFVVRVADQEAHRLGDQLKERVQEFCRVRVDRIEFVHEIPDDAPGMLDRRAWQ